VGRIVEHHAVTLGVNFLDTKANVVQYTLHVRAPRREISHRLLKRRHPVFAVIGEMRNTKGFELGEAVGVLGVAVDVTRLERREALLERGGRVGDRRCGCCLVRRQQVEALIHCCCASRRGGVPISEAAIEVVEAAVHGIQDELQRRIHGTTAALQTGKMRMGRVECQDRRSLIPIC
jgi:hypothetical protein